MPVSHWCKQNGHCEQTYYNYLKKIREEMVAALPVSVTEQSKFVKIQTCHSPLHGLHRSGSHQTAPRKLSGYNGNLIQAIVESNRTRDIFRRD